MKLSRIVVAVALLIFVQSRALAQMHDTQPMTPAQFAAAPVGRPVQIAVRIERSNRTALYAQLLERRSEGIYSATGKRVTLYYPEGTPVIMGSPSDVTAGALLFVYGIATKPGNADVKRIVVMTHYAQVK